MLNQFCCYLVSFFDIDMKVKIKTQVFTFLSLKMKPNLLYLAARAVSFPGQPTGLVRRALTSIVTSLL